MIASPAQLATPFRWTPIAAWSAMANALRPLAVLLRASLPHNADSFRFAGDAEVERLRLVGMIHRLAKDGRATVNAFRGNTPGQVPGCETIEGDISETDDLLLLAALATEPRDARSHDEVLDVVFALERRVYSAYMDLVSREAQYDEWQGDFLEQQSGSVRVIAAREVAHA